MRKSKGIWILLLISVFAWPMIAGDNDGVALTRKLSAATDSRTREQYSGKLLGQYTDVKRELEQNLASARSKHRDDRSFYSPLHVAILAIGFWQATSAEDVLLEIVDYTIDPVSLPEGILVSGDFFYPAIGVLVKLRVEPKKVIDAIAAAENDVQIQLLSWVLAKRLNDDPAMAKSTLASTPDKYYTNKGKNNLVKAMDILGKEGSSVDLIPSPYKQKK